MHTGPKRPISGTAVRRCGVATPWSPSSSSRREKLITIRSAVASSRIMWFRFCTKFDDDLTTGFPMGSRRESPRSTESRKSASDTGIDWRFGFGLACGYPGGGFFRVTKIWQVVFWAGFWPQIVLVTQVVVLKNHFYFRISRYVIGTWMQQAIHLNFTLKI